MKALTRGKIIQIWFVAVALAIAGVLALGVVVTTSTAVLLLASALVPPGILWFMWPEVQPQTAADVIHSAERQR